MSGDTTKAELRFFEQGDTDTLAQLVFDLAAQLHVERQRRMALEHVLTSRGLIDASALEALAGDPDFLAQSRSALDRSLGRLMRIVTEDGGRQSPLRAEDPAVRLAAGESRR